MSSPASHLRGRGAAMLLGAWQASQGRRDTGETLSVGGPCVMEPIAGMCEGLGVDPLWVLKRREGNPLLL